jgi:hypothetical protein
MVEGRQDKLDGDPGSKSFLWLRVDPQLAWPGSGGVFRSPEVRLLGETDRFTVIWSISTGTVLLPTVDVLRIDRP